MILAGRYRLLDIAGQGGMAEVWRAEVLGAQGFRRLVAIKRVLPNLSQDASFRAMFIEEARVSSMLDHPNVVQVFDFGEDPSGLFLAMEWVQGTSLRDVFERAAARGAALEPGFVLAIGKEILRALEAAHAHVQVRDDGTRVAAPIIHRDVSPANVLLSQYGAVKLADFGLARARDRAQVTPMGIVKGKLAYLPPERARGDRANEQSDLYSTAVILRELASLRRFHHARTDAEIVQALLNPSAPEPMRALVPGFPAAFAAVLDRALATDASRRFASASDFAAALGAAERELPERFDARRIGELVARFAAADAGAASAQRPIARAPAAKAPPESVAVEELSASSLVPVTEEPPRKSARPPSGQTGRKSARPPASPASGGGGGLRVPRPRPKGSR